MPVQHTHTVSQTLSNRSGIGHYCKDPCDYPDWKSWFQGDDDELDHFDSALDAAKRMWDAALSFPPPGSTYRYSTFGYTFAGAAMEGAVGAPITSIFDDYIREPFNLGTLTAEDRSVPNPKRSLLFYTDNREATPDDMSYKVLGGGLEGSAYDLARFGQKLISGEILDATSLATMWAPPDREGCGKSASDAMGWCIATQWGTSLVYKSGNQLGSNSNIRMFPDEGIVIVALTNREEGGHDARIVTFEIGRLMLDTTAVAGTPVTQAGALQVQALNETEIDEPDSEFIPAEFVPWPVSNPVVELDLDDTIEDGQEPEWRLFLPLITR
jgi:CubicO group peptidase (beta-lactamase class C family)